MPRSILALVTAFALALHATDCAAQETTEPAPPAVSEDDTLILLSVDVRTMPTYVARAADPPAPQWRTSFGSERRTNTAKVKGPSPIDADIVLLQGVTDVPVLRRWFPAGQWRLVVSRQIYAARPDQDVSAAAEKPAPVPTTAVAVRLRRGLRVTGQDHLNELADALGNSAGTPSAAGTAVRVFLDGRQTWAVSVLLPENCGQDCPGRAALERWHHSREGEDVRRVTGGRFALTDNSGCGGYGLKLDPAPPLPRQAYTSAAQTPIYGCAALATVAK